MKEVVLTISMGLASLTGILFVFMMIEFVCAGVTNVLIRGIILSSLLVPLAILTTVIYYLMENKDNTNNDE